MRYPGKTWQENKFKTLILILALVVFGSGLMAFLARRDRRLTFDRPDGSSGRTESGPVSGSLTNFRVTDSSTNQPISNQLILLTYDIDCAGQTECSDHTQDSFMTDQDGKVTIPQQLVRLKPKIYSSGYKSETYYTFLKSENPNELAIFSLPPGKKMNYDLTKEEVPLALTPVAP